MRYLLLALVAATACTADQATGTRPSPSSPNFDKSAPVHSVTGTGRVNVAPGFAWSTTVAVHQDATGRVSGVVNTHIIDLALYGSPGRAEMRGEAQCMRVVGNTAYIGFVITNSNDPAIGAVGSGGVIWVQDNGTSGPDIHYGGPSFVWDPSNQICSATPPALPALPVVDGNFTVR
ncbi:MAG TPA: hypothetical protein VF461_21305 [Gemmatimonadaceae bacterium]